MNPVTDAHLWALVALLCLSGWAATLFIVSRAFVPQANAIKVFEQVVKLQDDQIRATIERAERRVSIPNPKLRPKDEPQATTLERLQEVFGAD